MLRNIFIGLLALSYLDISCGEDDIVKPNPKPLEFPKFDLDLYKKSVEAKNKPIDIIALVELAYATPREYDCSIALPFGTIFFEIGNNPIGINGSDTAIITYYKDANIHLPFNTAKTFTTILSNLPTPIFNTTGHDLNVDKALQLAHELFKSSNRTNSLNQLLVFISDTSLDYPEKTVKLLKKYDVEIFVFALTKMVNLEQVYSIASSPYHVFWFSDYCSAPQKLFSI
ncbi:unnamed protein product [Gordionus sp. m RMFG-2023]